MKSPIVLGMPEAEYHAHPALSSSGARKLVPPSTPAAFDWERKNPSPPTAAMRLGRAVHREVLGIGSEIVVGQYPNYRTKESQQWRDAQEADGLIPLLAESATWTAIQGMAKALRAHPVFGQVFDPERGDGEASLFWTDPETNVPCRARLDFLPNRVKGRRLVVPDYKSTGKSADPREFARDAATYGYPQQDDWYRGGLKAIGLDRDPQFVFVVQETKPPYLIGIHQVSASDAALANGLNRRARHAFAHCTATGEWPGYGNGVHQLEMPTWWRINSEALIDESETAA